MIKKLFCACIYLYQGSAVRNLQDHTVVDNDAARLLLTIATIMLTELLF